MIVSLFLRQIHYDGIMINSVLCYIISDMFIMITECWIFYIQNIGGREKDKHYIYHVASKYKTVGRPTCWLSA